MVHRVNKHIQVNAQWTKSPKKNSLKECVFC